jgi:hypothetical protein
MQLLSFLLIAMRPKTAKRFLVFWALVMAFFFCCITHR